MNVSYTLTLITLDSGKVIDGQVGESIDELKRVADRAMRPLGASLSQQVDFHPGSYVFTDGEIALGLAVITLNDKEF